MLQRFRSVFLSVPGKLLGIVGQDPSDLNPTSSMLTSSGFAFIHLRYVL